MKISPAQARFRSKLDKVLVTGIMGRGKVEMEK